MVLDVTSTRFKSELHSRGLGFKDVLHETEAADYLNVSSNFLRVPTLKNEIASFLIGEHRFYLRESVEAWKQKMDAEREKSLTELVALSEELGLYD